MDKLAGNKYNGSSTSNPDGFDKRQVVDGAHGLLLEVHEELSKNVSKVLADEGNVLAGNIWVEKATLESAVSQFPLPVSLG